MSQEEIIKGNRLVAEFMQPNGVASHMFNGERQNYYNVETSSGRTHFIAKEAKYHTSWDWLMPVVEKIESLTSHGDFKYIVSIQGGYCCVSEDGDGEMIHTQDWESPKIQVVWETVVKFITWHNSNSPKN